MIDRNEFNKIIDALNDAQYFIYDLADTIKDQQKEIEDLQKEVERLEDLVDKIEDDK